MRFYSERNDSEKFLVFDLLLTDFDIPGQYSGFTLAKKLREKNPNLPVAFTTGHSGKVSSESSNYNGTDTLLMKPVDHRLLICSLEAALRTECDVRARRKVN